MDIEGAKKTLELMGKDFFDYNTREPEEVFSDLCEVIVFLGSKIEDLEKKVKELEEKKQDMFSLKEEEEDDDDDF